MLFLCTLDARTKREARKQTIFPCFPCEPYARERGEKRENFFFLLSTWTLRAGTTRETRKKKFLQSDRWHAQRRRGHEHEALHFFFTAHTFRLNLRRGHKARSAKNFISPLFLWTLGAGTRREARNFFFYCYSLNLKRWHKARSAKMFFFCSRFSCEPEARAQGAKRKKKKNPCFSYEPYARARVAKRENCFFPCFPCEP